MENKIGIVTVLFNSDDVLPGFFDSLSKQLNVNYILYVIDNSKFDSGSRLSAELAKEIGISAVCVFNDCNVGVAKGNNQGIELARRDGCNYILLANNDIEFEAPDTISKLVNSFDLNDHSAWVPKIYYHGAERLIWYAGGRFIKLRAISPHFGDMQKDVGQFDQLTTVDYAPTCFLLLKSEVFDTVGIFDEKYFVYYDDTDFLLRMNSLGLTVGFLPDVIIHHKVSYSTGGGGTPFSVYYLLRNRIYFVRKNYVGLMKYASLFYIIISHLFKFCFVSFEFKKIGLSAIADGFRIKLNNPVRVAFRK